MWPTDCWRWPNVDFGVSERLAEMRAEHDIFRLFASGNSSLIYPLQINL